MGLWMNSKLSIFLLQIIHIIWEHILVHSQVKFLSTKLVRHIQKLISSQDNKTYFEMNAEHICFWHGHTFVFMLSVWV